MLPIAYAASLLRRPLPLALMLSLGAVALVFLGGYWLRKDARRDVAMQCTAERELAAAQKTIEELSLMNEAHKNDAAKAAKALSDHREQLAASEKALELARTEADALRDATNKIDPKSADVVFDGNDGWLRKKRPNPASVTSR